MFNSHRILAAAAVSSALAVLPLTGVSAQPAPVPHAIITAQDPPEAARSMFEAPLSASARNIDVPGAAWLQLRFGDTRLREGERLVVSGADDRTQSFTSAQLAAWGGLTAVFNGSHVTVRVEGLTAPASTIRLAEIIVGLPAQGGQIRDTTLPAPLRNFLGPRAQRLMMQRQEDNPVPFQTETICGGTDDRIASNNPLVGRIVPVGCTGWLIDRNRVLTAGHCMGSSMSVLQFNVPTSQPDGTVVAPAVRDQYRITAGSVVGHNNGTGDDWALFTVAPNTETGLMPSQAQGGAFQTSRTDTPVTIRITGYGVDDGTANQTQQTHTGGNLAPITGAGGTAQIRYTADTQPGNSGSPVVNEANTNTTIGIHTNGGCTATGGENSGTGFGNDSLWSTLIGGLGWSLAGNTAGFGNVADGRPFWAENFDGQGGSDILFYFPGDQNWWLGRFDGNGALSWKLAGNTAGFGNVADGRPFWAANFDGQGGSDILFYFPGDQNWWLGRLPGE